MDYRPLGRTGWNISAISFGAWAIGGDAWGTTDDAESMRSLHRAIDLGVNFIDTADVYGDGHSERLVARLRRERQRRDHRRHEGRTPTEPARRRGLHAREPDRVRRAQPRATSTPTRSICSSCTVRRPTSTTCPRCSASSTISSRRQAALLRRQRRDVEEALRAARYPNVQSIQIIFNMFRLKPAEELFPVVREKQIGILARVPLASGLLSGKLRRDSTFEPRRPPQLQSPRRVVRRRRDVQRRRLRDGSRGGRGAARARARRRDDGAARAALDPHVPRGHRPRFPARRTSGRRRTTCARPTFPPLTREQMMTVRDVYDRSIRPLVHHRW